MKKTILILLGTSLLSISFSILAFERPSFEKLDVNKDNRISKKEFIDGTPSFIPVKNIFKTLDNNKDDYLDRKEFDKAKK
jgi:Ca2+-binding EF-hand superfamily protein